MFPQTALAELSSALYGLVTARDIGELSGALQRAISQVGFVSYNFIIDSEAFEEFILNPTLTDWSRENMDRYIERGLLEMDPLLRRMRSGLEAQVWSSDMKEVRENGEFSELLSELSISGGVNIALPASDGKVSGAIFLTRGPQAVHEDASLKLVQTIALLVQQRLAALGDSSLPDESGKQKLDALTGKQIEILKWVAAGKSNADISIILDLPRSQVNYHLREILKKLNVTSRIQAAAIYSSYFIK